jgi:hypothetical protein
LFWSAGMAIHCGFFVWLKAKGTFLFPGFLFDSFYRGFPYLCSTPLLYFLFHL